MPHQGTVAVTLGPNEEPLAAVERALTAPTDQGLAAAPVLSSVLLGDPYMRAQLAALRAGYELRPPAAQGLVARLRARLAWWLLGPELRQATEAHAATLRVLDSLLAHMDAERARVQRLEEALAYGSDHA